MPSPKFLELYGRPSSLLVKIQPMDLVGMVERSKEVYRGL